MTESIEEREQTDESLKAERGKTDVELAKRGKAVERSADTVLSESREKADEVLEAARDTADEKAEEAGAPAVVEERALADEALESERAAADERTRRERAERKDALASLLRLEREETDEHLLTERGVADEALNTRDIFLAMVSHDLRSMLGGIALAAKLLPQDFLGSGDSKTAVFARAHTIERLTARMNRLIGDLVDVASMEAGTLLVVPTEGDVLSLIRESIEVFKVSADAQGTQLTAKLDGPPLLARFDRERLLQVLANLLGNALKFSSRGAAIAIRAERSGAEVRVAVADTGAGIAAQDLETIFGKFSEVGRRDRRGLGLGLYISRCILEAHGGRIWAESTPKAGSTFFFALPT